MKKVTKSKIIENYIKEEIAKNHLKIGDQIMTEEQLCNHFGVSRMTVNKAITNLTDLGYIKRIPGKGSFVTTPHVSKNISNPSSFTDDMKAIGLVAGSKLISYQVLKAADNKYIKDALQLKDEDYIHYFIRLRTGSGTPIAISYTYISANIIPAIDVKYLNSSFYAYLDIINISDRKTIKYEISAKIPNDKQQELLKIDNNTALLKLSHITACNIDGKYIPFEYIETCYNSDLYSYNVISEV